MKRGLGDAESPGEVDLQRGDGAEREEPDGARGGLAHLRVLGRSVSSVMLRV